MKLLAYDIETLPMRGYFWSPWQKYVQHEMLEQDFSVLSIGYSWLDPYDWSYTDAEIISVADNKKRFLKNPYDDEAVLAQWAELVDEADIIIAHNGDKFDWKRLNTRLIYHDLGSVAPKTKIDTLKIAKHNFSFTYNRLDYLGQFLGVGEKLNTNIDLWMDIVKDNPTKKQMWDAISYMNEYCINDTELLARVYYRLREYDPRHPQFNLVAGVDDACPTCLHKDLIGYDEDERPTWIHWAQTRGYPRFRCNNCGSWCRGVHSIRKTDKRNI